MKLKHSIQVATFLTLISFHAPAWSKGAITKIVVEGGPNAQHLEITDRRVLDRFTIWSGPGVGDSDHLSNVRQSDTPAFIADWTAGTVGDKPNTSTAYLIKMFIEGRVAPNNTYEVLYVIDSNNESGYVYLPTPDIDDFGRSNMYQIARGVEGNWFHSTARWDETIRPLLQTK